MTHEEILAQEDAGWQALMAAVEGLSDADWLLPGAAGEWTLKNVAAHLCSWQEETLNVLPDMARQIIAGVKEPRRYDIDAWNAEQYAQRQEQSLAEVRSGLLTTRAALLAMIQRMPAEWLARYKHMRNWIAAVTYEHYAEHVEMIHAWRAAA
ncbi:MAG: DinB family protein [Anaerolineae bacterium]|uniref:DinB family protein n=1 Tax=Candidatus Amarolinea dominans TaxID=3140696 RepID=UPI001DD0E983|nr:DinB family protein [Anaerolineae bacterium]MBK7201500.1 DinB family protein [Anaerolineae bacterium]MBK9094982.1 DinB family protein [Anaerolineae bacterium]MBK9230499.1 DinB family protein [Anaerolineae bacterium]